MFCSEAGLTPFALREYELGRRTMRQSSFDKVIATFKRYHIYFHDDGTFECFNQAVK